MAEVTNPIAYLGANYEVLAAADASRSVTTEPCLVIPLGEIGDLVTVGPRLITEVEAGASVKDLIFGLLDHIVEAHNAIAVADRPAYMAVTRRLAYDALLNPTRTYTFTFTMAPDTDPTVKSA
jgi:hypothetical protein